MHTIILTVGLPGSGKSTWSIEELKKYPNKYKRFNKDLFRKMIDGNAYSISNEKFIDAIRNKAIETALVRGYDVIVDDTNFHNKHWLAMCDIAQRLGDVRVFEKYFDIPIAEAIKRNLSRPEPVPEDVIYDIYNKHIKNKNIVLKDIYYPKNVPSFNKNPAKKDAIIVDIDGTLAVHHNRSPYDYTKVYDDYVNEPVRDLVEMLAPFFHIIVLSGREDSCRELTEKWIKEVACLSVTYDLFMRKTGDSRKDSIIKKELYDANIEPYYNIKYAIDDRPVVIREWRKMGIFVLQVNDLDF